MIRIYLLLGSIFTPLVVFAGDGEKDSFFIHMLISWFPTIVLIILFIVVVRKISKRNKDYQDKLIQINLDIVEQIKRIADAIENKNK